MVKKYNCHMLLIFILEFSNYTKVTMGTLYTKLNYKLDGLRTPTYKKNNGQNTGEFYSILPIICDFYCTPGIYSVEHPGDCHRSDRNM